jgi:hypothetical protein
MATDESARAEGSMWPTSQLDDGTSDTSPAMSAPGSESLGSEMFPLFRANPREAHVDAERYDGRQLEHGEGSGPDRGWDDVSGQREPWGP